MNLWTKPNPQFDSDDALDVFLSDAKALLLMFDAPKRYCFQDLPKFLIYTLHMFCATFGQKPDLPYIVFGRQAIELVPKETHKLGEVSESQDHNDSADGPALQYKKVKNWRG